MSASVIAIASIGFTLQFATTGIFNLSYGEVMTVAAVVAYVASQFGLSLLPTLFVGASAGAALSLALHRGIFAPFARRGAGIFGMVVVTIAVGLVIQNILQITTKAQLFNFPFRSESLVHPLGMVFTDLQLKIIALTVAVVAIVTLVLRATKLGKAIRATSVNDSLARSCGIRTQRFIDASWGISGALAGLGGVIVGINLVNFNFTTGSEFLVLLISAAVLGGIGNPVGAVVGSVIVGVSTEMAATFIGPSYKLLTAFVILGIVLLARPQGIFSDIAVRKNVVA